MSVIGGSFFIFLSCTDIAIDFHSCLGGVLAVDFARTNCISYVNRAKFLNCGQACLAPDYVLVHHSTIPPSSLRYSLRLFVTFNKVRVAVVYSVYFF